MATVLARTATRSLRVSTRRWAPAALQLRCKSTARCVRLSRNKNAAASQNAIPVSKSHLSALSLNARSLYDDDDDDLRFAGMSGGKLVHEALVECGVDTVFGYSGGANLPILDQFTDSPINFVMNRSEQCCGHAAEGYARSSGRTGVILGTSGPGLTNIITPLQDARGDSTPIVALSGQVPKAAQGTDAFQECMAVDLTKPCTKWSYQVQSVEEVRSVVHEAFRVASTGKRGPARPARSKKREKGARAVGSCCSPAPGLSSRA